MSPWPMATPNWCPGSLAPTWSIPRQTCKRGEAGALHIELEQHHVAVFDDVFLAFHAVKAFLARGGDGTEVHQIVVSHGLGLDKTAREIRVDHPGGFRRGVADVNGPGADFLLARREIRPQAEQMIRRADERADAGF